jgi:hypothetical protein
MWYFTPDTGGGRFILPYLPAFSIVCAGVVNELRSKNPHFVKTSRDKQELRKKLGMYMTILVIFVSIISIGYRFIANVKYLSVLLGRETKGQFLTKQLKFAYGDFYDTDGYFASHIKQTDTVLLYGFHNLYYVDFPFIDSSWVKAGDKFDYIATQHVQLPEQYRNWKLVYKNSLTGVQLYKK